METGVNVALNQTLQWSHSFSAMDTSGSASSIQSASSSLQWSHDLSAMDTSAAR